jgi:AraC-like DNA-binding protein
MTRIPIGLVTKAHQLHAPSDFYHGLCVPHPVIPDNIILFTRLDVARVGGLECHYRFVLLANLQGRGSALIDESIAPLSPGQAILVFPYQYHHYANFKRQRIVWLFMTFELPDATRLLPLRNAVFTLSADALLHLDHCCDLFAANVADGRLPLCCSLVLEELLASAPASSSEPANGVETRVLLQRIGTYVYEHLDQPIRISDIAAHVAMSESHVRNRFRAAFGIPLARYVRQAKLTSAAALIATTEQSIAEIGVAVGFDSLYSFSRAFKSATRLSPTAYRRAARSRQHHRTDMPPSFPAGRFVPARRKQALSD